MRLRFSIRDLMWLTLVVALMAGWWLERRQMAGKAAQLEVDFRHSQAAAKTLQFELGRTAEALRKLSEDRDTNSPPSQRR